MLGEVALVFLRLGLTAFGGPAAHVAMMEEELVRRRQWLTHERFLDLLGAASLIPGPSSTELALYLGYERAGWRGLVLGGVCFILPAALIVGGLAWAYVHFGTLPRMAGVLHGIKPIVIIIVLQALVGLAPKAIKKSKLLGAVGVAACVAAASSVEPLLVLVGAGLAVVALSHVARPRASLRAILLAPLAGAGAAAPVGSFALFLAFAKAGALVFGSGYVLLAFLRADLVDRLHWLTEAQLVDAVAVGQVTPGPVFTTATFIGYLIGGTKGAIVATVGIFLPGFVLVALTRPLIARMRRSLWMSSFLDGVNVASLALMAVVGVQLGHAVLTDAVSWLIAAASGIVLFRWKVNATWLIAGGALVGYLTNQ